MGSRTAVNGWAMPPGEAPRDESWPGANEAKKESCGETTSNGAPARRASSFATRSNGYALLDSAHKRVDDRGDMTLTEVESCLKRG